MTKATGTSLPPILLVLFLFYLVDDFQIHVTGIPSRLFDQIERRMQHKVVLAGGRIRAGRSSAVSAFLKLGFVQRFVPSDNNKEECLRTGHGV